LYSQQPKVEGENKMNIETIMRILKKEYKQLDTDKQIKIMEHQLRRVERIRNEIECAQKLEDNDLRLARTQSYRRLGRIITLIKIKIYNYSNETMDGLEVEGMFKRPEGSIFFMGKTR